MTSCFNLTPLGSSRAQARDAPERIELPTGRTVKVVYSVEGPPTIAARIQDLYGIKKGLWIASRRVRVRIQVLATARSRSPRTWRISGVKPIRNSNRNCSANSRRMNGVERLGYLTKNLRRHARGLRSLTTAIFVFFAASARAGLVTSNFLFDDRWFRWIRQSG